MNAEPEHNDITLKLLVHFICAGTSALILSIAHTYPQYWFISLFALVPLLWRLNRTTVAGSILLGVILACCYAFVTFISEALVAPGDFILNLLLLSLVFSIFGIAVNGVRKYIGFSPIFIAALWLPLEYLLTHYSGLGSIFILSNADSGFVIRFASLFGFLIVSFCVILINSIILMFIEHAYLKGCSNSKFRFSKEKLFYLRSRELMLIRNSYHWPELRGPPFKIHGLVFN